MAELPEIAKYAGQMHRALRGKEIASVDILQAKCANIPGAEFNDRVAGAKVKHVDYLGKWITIGLDNEETILLNYGMGADVVAFQPGAEDPEKFQIKVVFSDESGFTVKYWWFGTFHLSRTDNLGDHPTYKDVALDPWKPEFSPEYLAELVHGKRTQVKAFILNQKNIGGIGNMYAHDILFEAGLHPKTKISDLDDAGVERLYDAIQSVFQSSKDKGTFAWEKDFHGEPGGWGGEGSNDFQVGYREGEPCPKCGTKIEQVKASGSATYFCPTCQPAPKA